MLMNIDEWPWNVCIKLQADNTNLTKKVAPAACFPRSKPDREGTRQTGKETE